MNGAPREQGERVPFTTFSGPGRFWRGNLHTHSTLSDGVFAPDAVAEFYRDAGYDFIALTEHFWPAYGFRIADTRGLRRNTFTTIPGAELHAPANSRGEEWHIVAVGLPLDFAPRRDGETGREIADRALAAGAFVGIAHPQWSGLTLADGEALAHVHAVEIYNHGCAVDSDRGDGLVLWEQLLAAGHRLSGYAADDAHFATPDPGGGWVMVKAEALEPELLVAALKRGDYYSSQGPVLHDIVAEGNEVSIACSPVRTLIVVGRGQPSRARHGLSMTRAILSLDPFPAGGYVRIVAIDDHGRRAWSNPVWR